MLIFALLLTLPLSGELHVDTARGYRIDVPDDWSRNEQDQGSKGHAVVFGPPGSGGELGVTVTAFAIEEGTTAETLLDMARLEVAGNLETYGEFEVFESEVAGRATPGVSAIYRAPSGEYRLRLSYLVEHGQGYRIQRHAPAKAYEEHAEAFEAVVASFAFVEISAESRAENRLAELAARCGSEVDWANDWKSAADNARKKNRLVLVAAFLLPGFNIGTTPRNTTFMDEDVIALVDAHFVPLWYTRGMEAAFVETYGLGPSVFGQALLLVTPEGKVVLELRNASDVDVAYAFLREGLRRFPAFAGEPPPADLSSLDRARRMIARGELEPALELLANETSGEALRLRARALRLLRRGGEALEAIAAAREASDAPEPGLLVEEAELLMRAGRDEEADAGFAQVVHAHEGTEAATKARLLRGLLDLRLRDRGTARRRWEALIADRPESRWAWLAASVLRGVVFEVDIRPDLGWPDEAVVAEQLSFPEAAPLGRGAAKKAAAGALAWLLDAQRPDGSWISPTELSSVDEMGPDPFTDAIAAIGARALLRHERNDGALEAADRALGFLLASIARREETPPMVFYMDYMTWSDAMMLFALAEAVEARRLTRDRVAPAVAVLVADLAERQVTDGGWSYYVTGDLAGESAPAQSISFTTAAAVLGLLRVRAAGFEVPDAVLDQALGALERMRDEDGVFAYFLFRDSGVTSRATAAPGAVGRGPACELALYRAGRSSKKRLRASLDRFLEHVPLFAAEQGKVLMHAGPDAQGCHYLFFDYTHAALVQEVLSPHRKTRAKLLDRVLDCRQPDGAFLDTPILGRAYGTAMALLCFDALSPTRTF